MAFYHPPHKQQGQYRYDSTALEQQGPARIFPHAGEDGVLRYLLIRLGQKLLDEGRLSQPWSLLLQQVEERIHSIDQLWYYLTTQLADVEIFQSGWFNLDLPPNEQFNADYVRSRRSMIATLRSAQKASQDVTSVGQARSIFYNILEQHGRSRPVALHIHQREGGLSDREFARQRLAGQNPVIIHAVQESDRALLQSWTDECTLASGDRVDLTKATNEHRLFIADYPLLKHVAPAELQPGRYVGSPVAIFYRSPVGLEPVLIGFEGKTITPQHDSDEWMRAKLYVQVADVTQHELITHLCDTHLAMEAFALATPRQLPANHPLYRLLKPHFQFLLAINTRGNEILLGEGGAIDKLLAPSRKASIALINRAYRDRPFPDHALPIDLQQRGVTADFLPDFPYRDDALLLWQAISRYVSDFLQRYYLDDTAIEQDPYLQAWAAELGQPLNARSTGEFPDAPAWLPPEISSQIELGLAQLPSYPRVPGFPIELSSLQQLIDIATQIIFTCGPQHAAVNFSQFDYVGYVPNAPLSAYCAPDDCTSLAQLLPPVEKDLEQIELAFALSGIRWGKLGSSELFQFVDAGDRAVLEQFQHQLSEIEQKIGDRNRQRLADSGVDYPYLLPSRIPNSINI